MAVRKGQFLLTGLVVLGLSLAFFVISATQLQEQSQGTGVYENLRSSIPEAVKSISEDYSNRAFMEVFHYYSLKHRVPVTSSGNSLSFTVVAGFREGQDMKVYLGNFQSESQGLNVTVNGNSFSKTLSSDEIASSNFNAADSYSIKVEGANVDQTFEALGSRFYLVHFSYSREDAVRQDTYIG